MNRYQRQERLSRLYKTARVQHRPTRRLWRLLFEQTVRNLKEEVRARRRPSQLRLAV